MQVLVVMYQFLFLLVYVLCTVVTKASCCHSDVCGKEENSSICSIDMIFRFKFDSCHPKLGQPLKTQTVMVVLSQGLSGAGLKSAQVQQMLNQKQHPSFCQAAVQASLSLWHQASEPYQSSSIHPGIGQNSDGQA